MPWQFAARLGPWFMGVACLVLAATSPLMAQDGGPPQAESSFLGMKPGPLLGIMAPVVVVLGLLLWGIKQPLAWIVVSVLAIAAGVGCAGFGITQALLGPSTMERLGGGGRTSRQIEDISIFIGSGLGATIAGVILLVVSLLRCRKSPSPKA